jgi:hypothetical protein
MKRMILLILFFSLLECATACSCDDGVRITSSEDSSSRVDSRDIKSADSDSRIADAQYVYEYDGSKPLPIDDAEYPSESDDAEQISCLINDDCTDRLQSRCVEGLCGPCRENGDCKRFTGYTTCDPDGKCVGCIDDLDCRNPERAYCVDQTCVQCLSDSDCGSEHCGEFVCVQCITDTHCINASAPHCQNMQCVPDLPSE